MSSIVNPYIAGNPVTGKEMFFGRKDVFTFIQQALIGQHRDNVIVLYGQRRTGKTSVLYQMHRNLDSRYLCIFVDLHGLALEGLSGFLWELANVMARSLRKDHLIELPRLKDRADFITDARNSFENEFLPQIWSAIGDRHVLLMLDEAIRLQEQIRAGRLEKEVFEYLRHLMQHYEQLNFLFSLGSGLEEMEKEYAFLFNVGLYKKISFLERDAAMALITQPVTDRYQLTPKAIDQILQITSGHAYYIQLLCHSLFNRWQRDYKSPITDKHIDGILEEVVERGLPVLKHVWEESTPGEKAVLAGLAVAMGDRNRPIEPYRISSMWQQLNVSLPENECAKAIKSLVARDVIVGGEKYKFAIDLQRLWVQKYERLEWVKEEIAGELQRWRTTSEPSVVRRSFWGNKTYRSVSLRVLGILILIAALYGIFSVLSLQIDPGTLLPRPTLETGIVPFASPADSSQLNTAFGWQAGNSPRNGYGLDSSSNGLRITSDGHTDQWAELDSQPIIFYPVEGNFETQVRLNFVPIWGNELAGLGVRSAADRNTWVRLGSVYRHYGGVIQQEIVLDIDEEGRPNQLIRIASPADTVYLKIERQGSVFAFSYSSNGNNWSTVADYVMEMPRDVEIFLTVGSWADGSVSADFYDFKVSRK